MITRHPITNTMQFLANAEGWEHSIGVPATAIVDRAIAADDYKFTVTVVIGRTKPPIASIST